MLELKQYCVLPHDTVRARTLKKRKETACLGDGMPSGSSRGVGGAGGWGGAFALVSEPLPNKAITFSVLDREGTINHRCSS